jgi:predicted DNA-binding protein with PD1-like motif
VYSEALTTGRTFAVVLEPGEDFFSGLQDFCAANEVRQGYIPMFIAAFSEVEIVGTCERLEDPNAPVWSSVHLTNVEALGCGTLALDPVAPSVLPHIHVATGEKARSATASMSHLLRARVQFLVEMVVVEVTSPSMGRRPRPDLYDVPFLTFGGR